MARETPPQSSPKRGGRNRLITAGVCFKDLTRRGKMDTKLLQKIAIGLICLSVLIIIGLTIFQHHLLKKMSQGESQEAIVSKEPKGEEVSIPDETYWYWPNEREIVILFTESLGPDNKLTDSQQQDLVNAMYQERKNVYSQQNYTKDRMTFPSEPDDKGIAMIMDITDHVYDGYIKGAGAILSPTQMEQFKAYLKEHRDMTESALKLNAQIYGGQTSPESGDKASK